MQRKSIFVSIVVLVALVSGTIGATAGGYVSINFGRELPKPQPEVAVSPLFAVGTGFTYQGRLTSGGSSVNVPYNFTFTLYDSASGGSAVGSVIYQSSVPVTNGLFTVVLDFGPNVFIGDARWLEISVQPASGGGVTILSPRQPISPSPYSLSSPWQGTSGKPSQYNPLRLGNVTNSLEVTGDVGQYNSVVIGSDGLPLISYYAPDLAGGSLRVAHCDNLDCSASSRFTLASGGGAGSATSITLGIDGLAVISYIDATSLYVKVAHCNNMMCSSATSNVVDPDAFGSGPTSITIGSDGLPIVAYYDAGSNQNLRIAHCANVVCTGSTNATLDSAGDVGKFPSIAIGANGLPIISYIDTSNFRVKVAQCLQPTCSGAPSIASLDSGSGFVNTNTAITIGSDGWPIIAYGLTMPGFPTSYTYLKAIHCAAYGGPGVPPCSVSSAAVILDYTSGFISATVGKDGMTIFTHEDYNYSSSNSHVKMIHCALLDCSSATGVVVDAAPGGTYSAVTTGIDGLPLISYYNSTQDLISLHCGSPMCVSYEHKR